MKIALAQLNYHIGNFDQNVQKIISALQKAQSLGVELVVFSELCICGYPPRDFLEYPGFINSCRESIEKIRPLTLEIDCILGCPWENRESQGKGLWNTAIYLSKGKIKDIIYKSLLPTYDIFDEYRYFEPGNKFHCIKIKNLKIALTICEDIWNIESQKYKLSPMDELIKEKPGFMINISASPFNYGQEEQRMEILKANVSKYEIPLVYVNQIGAQTELIFDGGSLVLDTNGKLLSKPVYFEESLEIIEIPIQKSLPKKDFQFNLDKEFSTASEIFHSQKYLDRIHKAIILGIRDFFTKSGFTKAVIGLSGGIDSALVTALAAEAIGPDNVLAVLMPSQFSSSHSITDSLKLIHILGIEYCEIPIEIITKSINKELKPLFKELPFSIAEENIQSRTRGLILMAISNKLGHILLNTSNKSEAAVGYGTLYGDMCGALSILGDLYKTQIFALSQFLNRERLQIPVEILEKAPSAELRPNQKDSDSLPDYEILDQILFAYIEEDLDYEELLLNSGFNKSILSKTLNLVNKSEFKRYQSPPILRISPKAFGMGRRMPIVGKYEH